jgi:hypothetical protein
VKGLYIRDTERGTSIHARRSIAAVTEEIALHGKELDVEYRKAWLSEDMDGSQGYIIAWILKLGGYLD